MLNLLLSGSLLVAWSPRVLLSFAAKIPTGGYPYLALFRLDSFHRIRLSFGLVAPCAHCALVYTLLAPPARSLLFIQ